MININKRKLPKKFHRARGFTLLEMVLVILIMGIISGVGAPMIAASFEAFNMGREIAVRDSEGRLAMERIVRELRSASSIDSLTSDTIQFVTDDVTIIYNVSGEDLTRAPGGILASNISGIAFTSDSAPITYVQVSIDMTIPGGGTYNLRTRVYPRNL